MTDDEIDAITNAQWGGSARLLHAAYRAYARAIESAAIAPLLERIAALEATLAASCADEREQLWEATPGGGCSRALDAESKVAELEAKLAYANEVIDQRNAMVSAALSAAPAAPEQQDQSEQHLGMVECRHCGGTGDAPYMTTSPVPYQRTEKCATCDGAGMVAQAPNAQQAEPVTKEMWQKLAETQGALMQMSQRVDELSEKYGLGAQQAEPPPGWKTVVVPEDVGPEPDWEDVRYQAATATGIELPRAVFSIVIREVRRWLAAQQAEAQEPFGFVWLEDGEWQLGTAFNGGPPLNAKAVFTRPQPAQLTAGDDRSHVICLCPDCIKPKDAPTAVQGEQP